MVLLLHLKGKTSWLTLLFLASWLFLVITVREQCFAQRNPIYKDVNKCKEIINGYQSRLKPKESLEDNARYWGCHEVIDTNQTGYNKTSRKGVVFHLHVAACNGVELVLRETRFDDDLFTSISSSNFPCTYRRNKQVFPAFALPRMIHFSRVAPRRCGGWLWFVCIALLA